MTKGKELSIPELLKEAEVEHVEGLIAEGVTAGTGIHPADHTGEDREVSAETGIQVDEDLLMTGTETEIVTLEEDILDPGRGQGLGQGHENGERERRRRDITA